MQQSKSVWLAWIVLAAALMSTAIATFHARTNAKDDARREFEFACDEIGLRIAARLEAHAQLLRSASALFDASDEITRAEWKAYTSRQKVERHLPGIQGIGFSMLIPRQSLVQHIQDVRN